MSKNKMDLINKYTRNTLTENDVYTFTITIRNNEIDDTFQAFDIEALNQMCKLCIGKTSLFEYPWDECLSARIYDAWIETVPGKKTSYGEPLTKLKASAYIIKDSHNVDLINKIEAGFKKHVHIACSAAKTICSICDKEQKTDTCTHVKGNYYENKFCFEFLSDVTDFYEWRFEMTEEEIDEEIEEKAFYNAYDGNRNLVKIVTKNTVNYKWLTYEMPQENVVAFLKNDDVVNQYDEIKMIFVNNTCIYSQLAHGPIRWNKVQEFFT